MSALPYPDREANRRLGRVASQLGGLMMGRYVLKLPGLAELSVEKRLSGQDECPGEQAERDCRGECP
jgi:hypothetical protein